MHNLGIMGTPVIAQQLGVPAVLVPLMPGVESTSARPRLLLPPGRDRFTGAPANSAPGNESKR